MARRLLTIKEAATLVHRAPLTVRRAIEAGKVPGARRVPIPGSRVSAPWMVSVEGLVAAGFVVDERAVAEPTHEAGSAPGAPADDTERLRMALANAEGRIVGLESAMTALVDLLREVRCGG